MKGKIFGRWEVLRYSHKVGYSKYFVCKCLDCQQEKIVYIQNIIRGLSSSCGCVSKKETAYNINKKYNDYRIEDKVVYVNIGNDSEKIMECDLEDRNKWRGAIQYNGKRLKSPKRYNTPEEAYQWYIEKSNELFGEFSVFKSRG